MQSPIYWGGRQFGVIHGLQVGMSSNVITVCFAPAPPATAISTAKMVKRTIFFTVRLLMVKSRTVVICAANGNLREDSHLRSLFRTQNMSLFNAADDLRKRTLARISGSLARLRYLAELRAHGHWGLQQTHGAEQAGSAIRQGHTEEFIEVLRTDLDELAEEFPKQEEALISPLDTLPPAAALEPDEVGGGSRRHFSALLFALSKLRASKRRRKRAPGA